MQYVVYRLYDRDDRLLYVGATNDWAARRGYHALRDPWFSEVWRVELEAHAQPNTAMARASALAREHTPRYQPPPDDEQAGDDLDWLTVREAARTLGVSTGRVRQWLASDTLTAVETPDGPRIHRASLARLRQRLLRVDDEAAC